MNILENRQHFQYWSPVVLQKIGYAVFFLVYKLFVHIEIRGKEHITGLTGPVILASNHTHELDVTAIPLVLPFFSHLYPIYFVSNLQEKYKTFGWRSYIYGGIFFNMLGGYAVHSGSHDYAVSLVDHMQILKNGGTLWMAPEGKRTRDGRMNPARGGLGYLVHATGATVLPIAIDTFFNMSVWDFFTFQRRVVISVGAPMFHNTLMPAEITQDFVETCRHGGQIVLDTIEGMMGE